LLLKQEGAPMFGRVTITAEGLAVLPAPPPPARGRLAGGHQLDARRDRTARYASRLGHHRAHHAADYLRIAAPAAAGQPRRHRGPRGQRATGGLSARPVAFNVRNKRKPETPDLR